MQSIIEHKKEEKEKSLVEVIKGIQEAKKEINDKGQKPSDKLDWEQIIEDSSKEALNKTKDMETDKIVDTIEDIMEVIDCKDKEEEEACIQKKDKFLGEIEDKHLDPVDKIAKVNETCGYKTLNWEHRKCEENLECIAYEEDYGKKYHLCKSKCGDSSGLSCDTGSFCEVHNKDKQCQSSTAAGHCEKKTYCLSRNLCTCLWL